MSDVCAGAICFSGPLFFCLSIYLYHSLRSTKKSLANFQLEVEKWRMRVSEECQGYKADALRMIRDEWLTSIRNKGYRNEIEVEVKFIGPLLRFLGYTHDDFAVRVPVPMQWGHERVTKEADWVIYWKPPLADRFQPHIVVEAKAPEQALDDIAQAQARSYAFSLNVPLYVLTNGHSILVYRRGVQNDVCVVNCSVDGLTTRWADLEQAIGAKPGRIPTPSVTPLADDAGSTPPVGLPSKAVARVIVRRPYEVTASQRAFQVFIDGLRVGEVQNGGEIAVEVTPGVHFVHLEIDWIKSTPQMFDLAPDGATAFVARIQALSNKLLLDPDTESAGRALP